MSASDGGDKPAATGPGVGRPAAETPARIQIRSEAKTPGESGMISAADTAMALALDVGTSNVGVAKTEAEPSSAKLRMPVDDDENPTLSDLVGTTLVGRYQITRKIGQGGMGAVFEATHTLIGKRVAVKVLLDKYARREAIVARLEQEARLASAIGHEHIIDINDFGQTEDGRTFVVMEFLEGESLAECLHREGKLPEQRILRIAVQIASALGAAHAKGIVHRDVKPENVFLLKRKEQDFVKVVDFGISKSLRASDAGDDDVPRLTQTGMVLGTPLYMSPEQARGQDALDHRIDIYALGVIMYELATGRVPFSGSNYLSVISQVLNDEAPSPRELRPELSEEFEAIVMRALEKDRADRYQTTEEMLGDLNAVLDDPTHSTERARITGPRRKPQRKKNRTALIVLGAAGAAGAAALAVVMLMKGPDKSAANTVVDAAPAIAAAKKDAAPGKNDAREAAVITFHIVTVPEGATIYELNRVYCTTPCDYPASVNEEKVSLVAHLDGYDDAPFTIRPQLDQKTLPDLTIRLKMVKPKKGAAPKVIIKKGGGGNGGTPTPPTGGGEFGKNPYTKPK